MRPCATLIDEMLEDSLEKAGQFASEDCVGGTPTAAVETTALPKKSRRISSVPSMLSVVSSPRK